MPGRRTPPTPERSCTWRSSAFTSVPPAVPAPGCTTRPAGLFTTIRWPSSCTTATSMSSGCGSAGTGAGTVTRTDCPERNRAEARVRSAVEQDVALVDQRLEPGAGEGRQALDEPHVESQAHGLGAGEELVRHSEGLRWGGSRGIRSPGGPLVARPGSGSSG